MALTRMRPRIPELRQALVGRFSAHHAVMLRAHLAHIDHLDGQIAAMDAEGDGVIAPFADQLWRLMTIPGVGKRTGEVIIAEIGVDMGRFPTAGHLASSAGLCPGHYESAGSGCFGRIRRSSREGTGPPGAAGGR
jgi:transposase